MLIICGFCICKFAYLVNLFVIPQTDTWGAFAVLPGHEQKCEQCELPDVQFPNEIEQGHALLSCLSSYCKQLSSPCSI